MAKNTTKTLPGLLRKDVATENLFGESARLAGVRSGRTFWRSWNFMLYLTVTLTLLILFLVCHVTNTPFAIITRDPLAVTDGQPYFGLLSNIGILFWCAATVICSFSWFVTRHTSQPETKKFLLCSGALTMLLLMDDLFMLHETVFPEMMGIRQRYVILTYMLLTLAWLVRFRKTILASRYIPLLLIAFGFFVISLISDLPSVFVDGEYWHHLFEDGAKLIGIVSWFNYFLHVCTQAVTQHCMLKQPLHHL